MKKVLFLHGLESEQGGPKVNFLSSVSYVYAPAMEYKNKHWSIDKLIDLVDECNPDLIIGSSMGGYLADVIGSYTGIEVLLFNPALHSRTLNYNLQYGKDGYKRTIILGKDDNIILPERTKELVGDAAEIIEIENMGHRTSLDVFVDIYNKYF